MAKAGVPTASMMLTTPSHQRNRSHTPPKRLIISVRELCVVIHHIVEREQIQPIAVKLIEQPDQFGLIHNIQRHGRDRYVPDVKGRRIVHDRQRQKKCAAEMHAYDKLIADMFLNHAVMFPSAGEKNLLLAYCCRKSSTDRFPCGSTFAGGNVLICPIFGREPRSTGEETARKRYVVVSKPNDRARLTAWRRVATFSLL